MIKISSIQFIYDQSRNITGYRIAFDGNGTDVQMLSGSLELTNEEVNLSNVALLVQKKLSSVLGINE